MSLADEKPAGGPVRDADGPELAPVLRTAVGRALHDGHAAMREVAAGLDATDLNWRPADAANTIAALIAHALDAERWLFVLAADERMDRDREAQFHVTVTGPDDLRELIERVELELDSRLAALPASRLTAAVEHGNLHGPGAWIILHAVEHSREHIGQAFLTRQLAEARQG